MLEHEMKWRKKVMNFEPGDCQCLPEMAKQMIEWALEEKLAVLSSNLKLHKETARKTPDTFKALSKLFNFTEEDIEEEQVGVASYEYLLGVIKTIPKCKRQTRG
jgi:hypothetical protein